MVFRLNVPTYNEFKYFFVSTSFPAFLCFACVILILLKLYQKLKKSKSDIMNFHFADPGFKRGNFFRQTEFVWKKFPVECDD
jgi:hypothetical protein